MMNLSFVHCSPSPSWSTTGVQQAWNQLSRPKGLSERPLIYGHDSVKTTIDKTEWMIVTGGMPSRDDEDFRVWFLNLTHADVYGEERWNFLNPIITPDPCPDFEGPKDDAWGKVDLWDFAVKCSPSPRQDHLTAVVNDYLFLFGGYSSSFDFDPHVYRLSLRDLHSNSSTFLPTKNGTINSNVVWHRIVPRNTLPEEDSSRHPLRGGIWHDTLDAAKALPKLVGMFGPPILSPEYYLTGKGAPTPPKGQIWIYDFIKDTWILWIDHLRDGNNGEILADYRAVLHQEELLLTGNFSPSALSHRMPVEWVNLRNKLVEPILATPGKSIGGPNQTLVVYQDANDPDTAVIIGFGPKLYNGKNLAVTKFRASNKKRFLAVDLNETFLEIGPVSRGGHTAVLSRYGNMYIFGGLGLHLETEAVWRINVGGSNCRLQQIQDTKSRHYHHHYNDYSTNNNNNNNNDNRPWEQVDWEHSGWQKIPQHNWEQHADNPRGYDTHNRDDSSDAGIGPLAILPFIILLIILIKNQPEQEQQQQQNEENSIRRHQHNGLPPEQIAAFPVRVFCVAEAEGQHTTDDTNPATCTESQDDNDADCTASCSICLVPYEQGQQVRDLPCGHFFHKDCVDNWLQSESRCPLCRTSLKSAIETPHHSSSGWTLSSIFRRDGFFQGTPLPAQPDEDGDGGNVEMSNAFNLELRQEN